MVQLEDSNHVCGPSCHGRDDHQTNDAGNESKSIEHERDGQDSQANLRLHHQNDGPYPSKLLSSSAVNKEDGFRPSITHITIIWSILRDISEYSIMCAGLPEFLYIANLIRSNRSELIVVLGLPSSNHDYSRRRSKWGKEKWSPAE
jgi:hypothetical protein